ncbi:uncharacterized protein LOC129749341 isoform X2 [Uranotaenia lowii]|uniref:uncharacterized protein LOC129749341 isoform X2 n=1 Tax=Uranotaenia lowii TaxID=190385 RepID=UPI00247ACD1F|nr:uncharacterized protein LOC129749341 isoform X2 [Uranotaenia lowii]
MLSLNLSKTKHMVLSPFRIADTGQCDLIVDSEKIERVVEFTYLGLTIDSALKWTNHIQKLKSDVTSASGLFWKISSFIPVKQLSIMYHAFVQSKLKYLIFIWGAASRSRLKPLQTAQNRCLKAVYKRPRLYPTMNLYAEADESTLPINALRELQAASIIHNHLQNPLAHHNQNYERPDHSRHRPPTPPPTASTHHQQPPTPEYH